MHIVWNFQSLTGALKKSQAELLLQKNRYYSRKLQKTVSDKMTDKDYINNGNMAY